MTVVEYLDSIKGRLLTDPIVFRFHGLRERATLVDGHLRAQLILIDGSQLEFSEYVQRSPDGEIKVVTYSYTGNGHKVTFLQAKKCYFMAVLGIPLG